MPFDLKRNKCIVKCSPSSSSPSPLPPPPPPDFSKCGVQSGSVASQCNTPSAPTWVSDLFVFALVVHVDNLSYANLSDFIYYFSYSSLTGVGKWFDLIYQCLDLYSSLLSPSLFIT